MKKILIKFYLDSQNRVIKETMPTINYSMTSDELNKLYATREITEDDGIRNVLLENKELNERVEYFNNENKRLQKQLKEKQDVLNKIREYCNENIDVCKNEQSYDECECCIEQLEGILEIIGDDKK